MEHSNYCSWGSAARHPVSVAGQSAKNLAVDMDYYDFITRRHRTGHSRNDIGVSDKVHGSRCRSAACLAYERLDVSNLTAISSAGIY